MKTIKTFLVIQFLIILISNTYAKEGCDWWWNNYSGTIYGKSCDDINWFKPGTVCCNWKDAAYTGTGGKNCPFGKIVILGDSTTDYFGNKEIGTGIKVAVNGITGDVVVVDYTNNLSKVILAQGSMFGDTPTSIYFRVDGNNLDIFYSAYNDTLIFDTILGRPNSTDSLHLEIDDLTADLYSNNVDLGNVISVYPVPINGGSAHFNIINHLADYGQTITVKIYNSTPTLVSTEILEEVDTEVDPLPSTGLYFFQVWRGDLYLGALSISVN